MEAVVGIEWYFGFEFDPTLHLTLIGLIGWLESIFCNSFLFLVVLGAGIAALSAILKTTIAIARNSNMARTKNI